MTVARLTPPGPDTAPYDAWGNLMGYVRPDAYRKQLTSTEQRFDAPAEWRPNEPFRARLIVESIERGRSAAHFVWQDDEGHRYGMFMVDALHLMNTPDGVRNGVAEAEWFVVKRGQNFGIAPTER